jgi:hypothetical protein
MKILFALIITLLLLLGGRGVQAQTATQGGPCAGFFAADDDTGSFMVSWTLENSCQFPISVYYCAYNMSTSNQCSFQTALINGQSFVNENQSPNILVLGGIKIAGFECPATSVATVGPSSISGAPSCSSASAVYSASILPNAVSVQTGQVGSVFATIVGSGGQNCRVAVFPNTPVNFTYQGTNPTTNATDAPINTAVNMANGKATFVLGVESSQQISESAFPLIFSCAGSIPAACVPNLSCLSVNISPTPPTDIVAEAETVGNTGVLSIPLGGASAFAVATDNIGQGSAITVSTDTGNATLPLILTLCQTNPSTGACLATAASTVNLTIAGSATPTFSVFGDATGAIASLPATNRVNVRFRDPNGNLVGSTSVAIQTH